MNNTTSENNSEGSSDLSGYGYYSFGLSIGVLLLFAFLTFILYYFSRRSSFNGDTQPGEGGTGDRFHLRAIMGDASLASGPTRVGLDDMTLRSYPVLVYSEAKLERKGESDSGSSCSICLGDYKEGEWLRVLPDCDHLFHRKCIDMWLRMNSSCPLCRNSPLPTPLSTPLAEVAPLATTRG